MKTSRRRTATILLLLLVPLPAAGQEVPEEIRARRQAVQALWETQRIRVESDLLGTLEGRVIGVRADTLLMKVAGAPRAVPVSAIDSVWERRDAAGAGALTGFVLGGLTASALGILLVEGLCDRGGGCTDAYPRAVGVGFLVGGGAGVFVGGAVGSFIPRWEQLFP